MCVLAPPCEELNNEHLACDRKDSLSWKYERKVKSDPIAHLENSNFKKFRTFSVFLLSTLYRTVIYTYPDLISVRPRTLPKNEVICNLESLSEHDHYSSHFDDDNDTKNLPYITFINHLKSPINHLTLKYLKSPLTWER